MPSPHCIELKLRDINQLFNTMDPSPFHEKDLDHDAEEFIESWAKEYPLKDPFFLRIHLDQQPEKELAEATRQAIHNYFRYRADMERRDFRHLMKQARTSLFIGLGFLAACLSAAGMVERYASGVWGSVLSEGFTIAGWVAMWRPIQLYLYDWLPLRRQAAVFQKLSEAPVEIVCRA